MMCRALAQHSLLCMLRTLLMLTALCSLHQVRHRPLPSSTCTKLPIQLPTSCRHTGNAGIHSGCRLGSSPLSAPVPELFRESPPLLSSQLGPLT